MASCLGARRRLSRIVPPDRAALWLPLDDALISGPEAGLRDPRELLVPEVVDLLSGVLGFRGLLTTCEEQLMSVPFIMNLSASTLRHNHTHKVNVGRVEDAVRLGADAIAYHLNISSPSESEMLSRFGTLVGEAEILGIPVVALAYPRSYHPDGRDENYLDMRRSNKEAYAALVRHCVRIAIDLGASAVKTIYTGSVESFESVVTAAVDVPVLIAGEELLPGDEAVTKAREAIRSGAAGIAFGRQVFQREEPHRFVDALHLAVEEEWNKRSVDLT